MKRLCSLMLLATIWPGAVHAQADFCGAAPGSADPPQEKSSVTIALELNIPAFRLDVIEAGRITRSFPVAVGTRRYHTPTGEFGISRMVWNPWWYPPDAAWAASDSVTPPGPRNPMGKVKFLLNGTYYLHGTPLAGTVGSAASHGCIRMRNVDAIALARIVQWYGKVPMPDETVDSLTKTWNVTRVVDLDTPIPVSLVYRLAEVRDSMLTVHPDVYRVAGDSTFEHVLEAVSRSGIGRSNVVESLVRELVKRARDKSVSVPLRSILIGDTPAW